MFSILFLRFSYYRFHSISLILEAHQQPHWYLVQTKDVVLGFNPQILSVLHKTINVDTPSSTVMAVAHQDIMCRICCISIQFLAGLWWKILQLLSYSGELLWICQNYDGSCMIFICLNSGIHGFWWWIMKQV
jgi:hypothetical protein